MKWKESQGADRYRRGLYIHFQRTSPYPELVNFDAPDSRLASLVKWRDEPQVRLQLALTLGEAKSPQAEVGVRELIEVAAEFNLQARRTARKGKFLQLSGDALQDRQSFLPFFWRELRRRLVIGALDQLTSRGDAHPAKNSFCLTDVNLLGRKINMRAKIV